MRRRDESEGSSIQVSSDLLEWLWDSAACPILDELGFRETPARTPTHKWPRIWWIPTGLMSRLPLHAAGRHYATSSETVLDRVVSSYSPSIKALIYARRNTMQKDLSHASKTTLLVSMRTTPQHPDPKVPKPGDLRFAEEEIQILGNLLSSSTSKAKKLEEPCKGDVLGSIDTCTIFHFAGHGISDPLDPSKSCLLLNDWVGNPLTVEDLTELKLYRKSPWLAYLSACSTGESQAENLQDEAMHLVSACQLAGFPHVVGSLWKVDDECSADAAREVYEAVRDKGWSNEAVALGVHNAARFLRRKTGGGGWRAGPGDVLTDVDGDNERGEVAAPVYGKGGGSGQNRGLGYARREEGNPSIWPAYIHVGP
ncbi:CHAT domain-containing protein [Dactylonectria macrodidyma]|uniref:CHAT domain-containing protein n=1 Tax=Dactylonectria macrodidyma TaxID=307937 RepID=A0A9P9DU84_9HYPO|nr:CHAT domain-containing protein [Dactylonectria macrodidyma]